MIIHLNMIFAVLGWIFILPLYKFINLEVSETQSKPGVVHSHKTQTDK